MPQTDFQLVLKDLREAKYTDTQLAHLCGCTRQYIHKIRVGDTKVPGYEIGRKLIALHEASQ